MWNNDDHNEGGGFDTTSNMFASPAQGETQQTTSSKPKTLAPVSIKQILDSSEDGLKLKDIEVQMVKVVGIVKSIDVTTIRVTFTIEDDSGEITGIMYVEGDTDATVPVIENTYCVVLGSIRSTDENKHLMIFNIYPITDINEVYEHILAVSHAMLKADNMENGIESKEMKHDMMSSYGETLKQDMHSFQMDPRHRRVYDVITRSKNENGMNIKEIMDAMPPKTSIDLVRASLDYLIGEGHLFTTIDEHHFKSTESSM